LKTIFISFFLFLSIALIGQAPKRLCVIGSSTAYGYFPPPHPTCSHDSGWVAKINKHYKDAFVIDTTYNLAILGTDCYSGMPTSYIPPAGENTPNIYGNISYAVSLIPKPTAIIINYPSNNYERLSNAEIIQCLQTIKDTANANNIRCYIATSQPRNSFDSTARQKLKDLRNDMLATFGNWAIDFFTPITEEPSLNILPQYELGDFIHINPTGHTMLAQQVINKNIFTTVLPIQFAYFTASQNLPYTLLNWGTTNQINTKNFLIQASEDGKYFYTIKTINATVNTALAQHFSYKDVSLNCKRKYYKIIAVDNDNSKQTTTTIYVNKLCPIANSIGNIFPQPSTSVICVAINFSTPKTVQIQLLNSNGRILQQQKLNVPQSFTYKLNINTLPAANYYVKFITDTETQVRQFVKM
jgi:Secretion system C-terminal sorting domain